MIRLKVSIKRPNILIKISNATSISLKAARYDKQNLERSTNLTLCGLCFCVAFLASLRYVCCFSLQIYLFQTKCLKLISLGII